VASCSHVRAFGTALGMQLHVNAHVCAACFGRTSYSASAQILYSANNTLSRSFSIARQLHSSSPVVPNIVSRHSYGGEHKRAAQETRALRTLSNGF